MRTMPGPGDLHQAWIDRWERDDGPEPPDIWCPNCETRTAQFVEAKRENGWEWAEYACYKCEQVIETNVESIDD